MNNLFDISFIDRIRARHKIRKFTRTCKRGIKDLVYAIVNYIFD